MSSARRKSSRTSLPLIFFFIALLCVFPAIALASSAASQPQTNPEDELICHTDDPKECYYKIFRPTDEFQIIHNDQEIPTGLHVRMNMTSGKLEAKINVEGEVPPELEGVESVDQSVLVVEPEAADEPVPPKGAPQYENVGKVKEPKEPQGDAGFFKEAMGTLGMLKDGAGEGDFDANLEMLEEISHDIYYGLKITEDLNAMGGLMCLMWDPSSEVPEGVTPRDQQAAAILAGALSNNPTALAEVEKLWPDLIGLKCPSSQTRLNELIFRSLLPKGDAVNDASAPAKVKAKVLALNGLIKNDRLRSAFLDHDGMKTLLEVLLQDGKQWTAAQRKVGQLALDNFLDEDMGATLGLWPTEEKLDDKKCQTEGKELEDGCWDYQVGRIMKANKGDKEHWSKDLHDRLAAYRKANPKPPPVHYEL